MRRLSKFLSLSLHEKRLFFEAFGLLLLSHLCVKIIAFRHIYRFLSALTDETTVKRSYDVRIVNSSLLRAASLLPWTSSCLSRSIVAFIMLRRRGVPAVMFIGARFEHSLIDAHAWIQAAVRCRCQKRRTCLHPIDEDWTGLPMSDGQSICNSLIVSDS